MCSFNASIGLLPLIFIVSSNEDELYRFEGHTDRFHLYTEQNVQF